MWRTFRRAWYHMRGRVAQVAAQRCWRRYVALIEAREKYFRLRDRA